MKASNLFKRLIYPKANLNEERMRESFANHWVVVTGASRGIGEALVRQLIASHANLFLIARSEEQLHSLCNEAREAGCNAEYCAIDLRDKERLDLLCQHLKETMPRVDYLFCNAGKSIHRDIIDAQDRIHDYDRTMDLNYRAHVALTLALLPKLSESKGHIIYTSSVTISVAKLNATSHMSRKYLSAVSASIWYIRMRRHVRNCDDKVFPYRLLICHSFIPKWSM